MADGGELGIAIAGSEHTLAAEDLLTTIVPPDGYSVERDGSHAVALELAVDDDLLREGRSREVVHAVQNARKEAGLQVEDRIVLRLWGDTDLLAAAEEYREQIARETLALDLALGAPDGEPSGYRSTATVEGLMLEIELSRAA